MNWSDPDHDVLADVRRIIRLLREAEEEDTEAEMWD